MLPTQALDQSKGSRIASFVLQARYSFKSLPSGPDSLARL